MLSHLEAINSRFSLGDTLSLLVCWYSCVVNIWTFVSTFYYLFVSLHLHLQLFFHIFRFRFSYMPLMLCRYMKNNDSHDLGFWTAVEGRSCQFPKIANSPPALSLRRLLMQL